MTRVRPAGARGADLVFMGSQKGRPRLVGLWLFYTVLAPPPSRFLESPLFAGTKEYSEETARMIDGACKATLAAAHDRASSILTRRRSDLNLVAKKLVERETLSREDLDLLLQNKLTA